MNINMKALCVTAVLVGAASGNVYANPQSDAFNVCEAEISENFGDSNLRMARKKINTRGSTIKVRYRVTSDKERYGVNCVVKKGRLVIPLAIQSQSRDATNLVLKTRGTAETGSE